MKKRYPCRVVGGEVAAQLNTLEGNPVQRAMRICLRGDKEGS